MREQYLLIAIDCYKKFAPVGDIDYRPHAERFLDSYLEALKEGPLPGESTFVLIGELVRRTFTPREAAAFRGKMMSITLNISFSELGNIINIRSKLL